MQLSLNIAEDERNSLHCSLNSAKLTERKPKPKCFKINGKYCSQWNWGKQIVGIPWSINEFRLPVAADREASRSSLVFYSVIKEFFLKFVQDRADFLNFCTIDVSIASIKFASLYRHLIGMLRSPPLEIGFIERYLTWLILRLISSKITYRLTDTSAKCKW